MPRHRSHRHELSLKCYKKTYMCDGCKMDGHGERYRCIESCDYDLHKECMHLSPTRTLESFPGSTFKLLDRPPRSRCGRACDVCGMTVQGIVYHCKEKGLDVHPLCALLEKKIRADGVEFELKEGVQAECNWCKERRLRESEEKIPGFFYVSECGKYSFHVHCLMNMGIESGSKLLTVDQCSYETDDVMQGYINRGRGGWGGRKFVKVVKMFLKVVLSILFGDPTAILASVLVEMLPS